MGITTHSRSVYAQSQKIDDVEFTRRILDDAPFNGGRGARSLTNTNFYSVDHSIRAWVTVNECDDTPVVEKLPDETDDGMTVQRKTHAHGKGGAEVVLIEFQGRGHTWPGREPPLRTLGKSTRDVSANDQMWEFFEKHPRK